MARRKDRLKKRGNVWWTWWYVPEVQGDGSVRKRKHEASTGQRSRALAATVAERLERESVGQAGRPAPLPLSEAFARYLVHLEAVDRSPKTVRYYEQKCQVVMRLLGGNTDAHLLAAPHADGYLARRRAEGVAVATVAKELGALRTALTFCARRDIYRGDPKWCLPPELRGAYVPRERALTIEEYRQLREALAPERRDYLAAFVGLGVRDSELYRITAADWVGGRVHIRGRKGRRDRADRWMTPPAEVAAILDRRVTLISTEGTHNLSTPVFPAWPNVRRDLHRGCERAGIPPVSPNDLRRTFASWLAERGVPELVTASLMGHSNSAMVRRVYARIGTTAQVDAVGLLPPLG